MQALNRKRRAESVPGLHTDFNRGNGKSLVSASNRILPNCYAIRKELLLISVFFQKSNESGVLSLQQEANRRSSRDTEGNGSELLRFSAVQLRF